MAKPRIQFRASKSDFFKGRDRINLFGFTEEADGGYCISELGMKKVGEFEVDSPFTGIDNAAAQILMDDLWSCGIRPSEGSGSAGSLKATQDHLADMRKIAFNQLKIG